MNENRINRNHSVSVTGSESVSMVICSFDTDTDPDTDKNAIKSIFHGKGRRCMHRMYICILSCNCA